MKNGKWTHSNSSEDICNRFVKYCTAMLDRDGEDRVKSEEVLQKAKEERMPSVKYNEGRLSELVT